MQQSFDNILTIPRHMEKEIMTRIILKANLGIEKQINLKAPKIIP